MHDGSLSPHWIKGLWDTVVDYGHYLFFMTVLIWGMIMWSLKTKAREYVTKTEMKSELAKISAKQEAAHEKLSDKIDVIKDLLITHFQDKK